MDVAAFLEEITALSGVSGHEGSVAARVTDAFRAYTDDVWSDALGNVFAAMGNEDGPTVLSCAHMDEIGLMAFAIDERGGIRISSVGGVDPRILPGSEVTVHGREDLFGVIGVKPPHLTAGPQEAPKMDKLAVDVGLPVERVRELVRVGDPITFLAQPRRLAGERFACKTMDDRACLTSMLVAMEQLQGTQLACRAIFCATVSEEVGCYGAQVAGHSVNPDMAIAFDVTHGPAPGVEAADRFPLDTIALARGPFIHPAMHQRLKDTAKDLHISVTDDVVQARTSTDGDALQIAQWGVPIGLLSVPLSYMHTTVETLSLDTVKEAGRLLAGFIRGVDKEWEAWLCLADC